ncbi:alpha-amylase domain-containing protein [Granulicella tundricola]|uniref:Alpha amylase catalytic region n=1 Tax=Granulicella tundricola (strain ATCC BAA-1859 / DSM 23138 / MP5ACTX9) TaxID=1198114 RepID=E8WVE5_GRATM|nr:alpha-amylase domain-containing protein [Granulicella tundricola]ADW68393.1 alpha amylase catalytic region [Granulicella tundricola MP5ACTX9]
MAVMMQAFYWDAPKLENREHDFWNFIAERVEDLGKAGINALWLPPINKGSSNTSMGYDPYDFFDLGDFDQKGGTKTWYGNRAELEALITKAHANSVGVYADMVINHNSGADEEEVNPLDGEKRWTKFNPASGIFPRDWNSFHPSRFERTMVEGEHFAGFPHLCHRNPSVYKAMFDYARLIIEDLDFDGFRFDFVKGYGSWMISLLSKYQYEKKDMKEFMPYVVCELWSGGDDIDMWLDKANSVTDNQIAAFDFPLRYQLKAVCDQPNYDLRNLTRDGSVVMARPAHAATFVDNHDMGEDIIQNDKLMAYSFIMVHEGYPCIFWFDYYNNGLARPFTPNGINALIEAHHKYAGGDSQILHADPDLYIMQRVGWKDDKTDQPGLVYVLNNLGDKWSGTSVKTKWCNQRMVPIAWDGHGLYGEVAHPDERRTDAEGNCEFPAPPRGYCIYVPIADDANKDEAIAGV